MIIFVPEKRFFNGKRGKDYLVPRARTWALRPLNYSPREQIPHSWFIIPLSKLFKMLVCCCTSRQSGISSILGVVKLHCSSRLQLSLRDWLPAAFLSHWEDREVQKPHSSGRGGVLCNHEFRPGQYTLKDPANTNSRGFPLLTRHSTNGVLLCSGLVLWELRSQAGQEWVKEVFLWFKERLTGWEEFDPHNLVVNQSTDNPSGN